MTSTMEKVCVEQALPKDTDTAIFELACSPLFKPALRTLSVAECTKITYQRAKAISKTYGKTFGFYLGY